MPAAAPAWDAPCRQLRPHGMLHAGSCARMGRSMPYQLSCDGAHRPPTTTPVTLPSSPAPAPDMRCSCGRLIYI
eukprot:322596-Chlamydomonas_euryale.AAC.1